MTRPEIILRRDCLIRWLSQMERERYDASATGQRPGPRFGNGKAAPKPANDGGAAQDRGPCEECIMTVHTYDGVGRPMRIATSFVCPPIPYRGCDWCAYLDDLGADSSPYGWGKTEAEAVADLRGQLDTRAPLDRGTGGEPWVRRHLPKNDPDHERTTP